MSVAELVYYYNDNFVLNIYALHTFSDMQKF